MKNATIKILLIEDDKIDQIAFKEVVDTKKLPYDYVIAGSVSETQNLLPSNRFDVIIADYMLGDGTAFDLFSLIGNLPIIFVTGAGYEDVAAKAMKMGVYDYLVKDFNRQYLKKLPAVIEKAYQYKSFAQTSKSIKKSKNKVALSEVMESVVFTQVNLALALPTDQKRISSQMKI
ncbi:MAG: response regulator [Promethearchaeota archaeon]